MANISARWHGDDYQSRRFWIHASSLLDCQRPDVIEVTFEAEAPKAFDDIVVRYHPGRRNVSGPDRITAEHYQIKWHTDDSGHFGYEDLVDPAFLRAPSFSLLQRLRDAKTRCETHSAFHFVTTYNLKENDPLTELVDSVSGALRLHKLLDSTTTDRSRMGRVRKLWRDHLELSTNDELKDVLQGFHIEKGADTLEALRDKVSLYFRIVGLKGRDLETTFIYDQAARDLVDKKINRLDRDTLREYCAQEGWFIPIDAPAKRGVSIQTYEPRSLPADIALAAPENTLVLQDHFEGRHLRDGESWDDIRDEVTAFLKSELIQGPEIRLFLEAPASIAFLSGACLGLKSGASVEVVQTGAGNSKQVWDTDDHRTGPKPDIAETSVGEGGDIALVLSLTRNALPKAQEFVARSLPSVGTILQVTPADGSGQKAIRGGEHALNMAQHIAEVVSDRVLPKARVHIFLAAPNAFSFYLGQQADAMGTCVLYEFDFKKEIDASYYESFEI